MPPLPATLPASSTPQPRLEPRSRRAISSMHQPQGMRSIRRNTLCNSGCNITCHIPRTYAAAQPQLLRHSSATYAPWTRDFGGTYRPGVVHHIAPHMRTYCTPTAPQRAQQLRSPPACIAPAWHHGRIRHAQQQLQSLRHACALIVAYRRECHAILAAMYPLMLHTHCAAPAHRPRTQSAATADAHSDARSLS